MAPLTFPRVPLKQMDPSMLVFELGRETDRLLPRAAGEMITSAATLAAHLHRAQTRFVRGDLPRTPYIEHPLRVTLRLMRWGVQDADLIAAALLHDVAEDCDTELLAVFGQPEDNGDPIACLRRLYGDKVAEYVSAVTNPPREAGISYAEHLHELSLSRTPALLIKASDLKDNAGSIKHQLGHGQDEKMHRMMHKYSVVLKPVADGLLGAAHLHGGRSDLERGFQHALREIHALRAELSDLIERAARPTTKTTSQTREATVSRGDAVAADPSASEDNPQFE